MSKALPKQIIMEVILARSQDDPASHKMQPEQISTLDIKIHIGVQVDVVINKK